MGPTARDLKRIQGRWGLSCQTASHSRTMCLAGRECSDVFRTFKRKAVLSLFHCSYSIKVLHGIGNAETEDRYQLGAPFFNKF